MIIFAILLGCILGAIIGINAPTISYTFSGYLAIAIIAALDSVFGGITSVLKGNFDIKIFISGFCGNAILFVKQGKNQTVQLKFLVVFPIFIRIKKLVVMVKPSMRNTMSSRIVNGNFQYVFRCY